VSDSYENSVVFLLDMPQGVGVDSALQAEVDRALQDLARHLEGAQKARERLMRLMGHSRQTPAQ